MSRKYNFERIFEGDLSGIEHVMALNNFDFTKMPEIAQQIPVEHAKIQSVLISNFKIEWVFGRNFEEHRD